ncbi:hypothetical protein L7F22_044832 [Adiantum nelumboides]|nr:hypothetical protein [Adiantum nelumboides]
MLLQQTAFSPSTPQDHPPVKHPVDGVAWVSASKHLMRTCSNVCTLQIYFTAKKLSSHNACINSLQSAPSFVRASFQRFMQSRKSNGPTRLPSFENYSPLPMELLPTHPHESTHPCPMRLREREREREREFRETDTACVVQAPSLHFVFLGKLPYLLTPNHSKVSFFALPGTFNDSAFHAQM